VPTKNVKKTANTYPAHRERQRRRIVDAAGQLFDDRGIDRVTMAEITSASGVQPSTVYQYFRNKDDIVWAILEEVIQERSRLAQQSLGQAPNALARITVLLESMADELANDQVKVRFMAQFDALYARSWPVERLLKLESQFNPQPFRFFSELIREGIADGTLRPDLDSDLTMQAVVNAVIGSQRRLASLGSKVELEYGQPIDRLFRETIRVLLLGMRAEPKAPKKSHPRNQKAANGRTKKRSL
jgi:AcrR family transcriptional regulator